MPEYCTKRRRVSIVRHACAGHRRRHRFGFTLIEMVASMTIMVVLIIAMGSAILIASYALPDADNPTMSPVPAAGVVDQIASELQTAISISQYSTASPTMIEFVVDRYGANQTIRYEWLGTAGDPLTRQYNGGTVVNVLDSAYEFNLDYVVNSQPSSEPPPVIEGPEQLFLLVDSATSGGAGQYSISSGVRIGQYFVPTLPADTISWRVTRMHLMLASAGSTTGSNLSFEVLREDVATGAPGAVVDQVTIPESTLSNGATWHEIIFANAGSLDPAESIFVVASYGSGNGQVGKITTGLSSTNTPGADLWYFDGTWQARTAEDVWLYLWGTVSAPDPNWTPPTTSQLVAVAITINSGTTPASRLQTQTLALNKPVLP